MVSYDVTSVCDLNMIRDPLVLKNKGLKIKNKGNLCIMKYDKGQICNENFYSLGLFRSIVVKDGKIISFSPPKSMNYGNFRDRYNINDCRFEEFVEGTMIHCFFDERWEIATKSVIGAGFKGSNIQAKTFKDMFLDAMFECKMRFDHLNKDYSYIFILQHPDNRIVTPFEKPALVLLKIYKNEELVHEKNIYAKEFDELRMLTRTPYKYTYTTWEDVDHCHDRLDWFHPGVMMYAPDGTRSKIRNKKYENVKRLKGNSFKMQYQYLNLRKMRKIGEFLKYYPELQDKFTKYRNDVHVWTKRLYNYYVGFKIKHEIENVQIPYQFRPHVWNLHNIYIAYGKSITFQKVIQYVNDLDPRRMMFAMNYELRETRIASSSH